ncbi:MAG TPA: hypothetical protein VGR29_13175 [Thermomicrobiales bacterium]|nr:hypothetical protein [Thermomicrobiales bacterium]
MRRSVVSLAFVLTMVLGAVPGPARVAVAAPAEPAVCVAETITGVISTAGGRFLATAIVVVDA